MNHSKKFLFTVYILLLSCTILCGQTLEQNFKNPPHAAKPKTWMHAMSGNMSKVGMTKDLEAIAAAGQGGILLFNIANKIPYGNVPYNSDAHHEILKHTAKECERLNLSFGVHNCDGWTSSGGPWITPEQSMKMVVWSETVVEGGKNVNTKLPQPTTIEGFYKDIAVLAYPSLETEITDAAATPIITASDDNFDITVATDNWNERSTTLNTKNDDKPWIVYDYGKEHAISSLYVSYFGEGIEATLETSKDGENYTQAKLFKHPTRIGKKKRIINDQFDPIKARYFRISFEKTIKIREMNLKSTRPYKNYLGYSGLGKPGNYLDISKDVNPNQIIAKSSILNLTSSLTQDGFLKGELPRGKWTVMRFGYTSTGATNWPASKWGIGLECDKFSRPAFKSHFDAFVQKVIDNTKQVAPNALQYIEIDSYEMGGQNWTQDFASIFENDKEYDLIPFLPIFAGRYIDSAETVAGIAFDINDVYVKLMTNNYFKYFTELCNEYGLKSYIEPYGNGPVSPLDISEHIDLPMTEFWMNRPQQKRLTGTISGAHIYGKNIISAESFTARPELNWKMHPALAKTWGDMAWVTGVNEFMFHRYVHQPNTQVKPGLTMGTWGSHIDRTQHWWMNAGKSWFKYIARGSFLLRQGFPVADVLVFVGDVPHKDGYKRDKLDIKIPLGLNYDCTNTDALLNRFTIRKKALQLPEGNTYKYLVLQDAKLITLPTLRKLKEIVDNGIIVIGEKPLKLTGYKVSDNQIKEFNSLVSAIWSQPNCNVSFDFTKIQADFTVKDHQKGFVHRKSKKADIYFFYNETAESVNYECTFRISDKIPELWDANTGEITKIARFKSEEDETRVWIKLKPLESAFILFRESAEDVRSVVEVNGNNKYFLNKKNQIISLAESTENNKIRLSDGETINILSKKISKSIDLSSSWNVEFLETHEYKANIYFDKLTDWKDHVKKDIKYYSGTAIYRKTFNVSEKLANTERVILDLGNVKIAAEVFINGKNAGTLWMAPFTLDISDYLLKGKNLIEVRITNQWTNRLVGDARYPEHYDNYKLSGYIPRNDSKMPDWYLNNEPMPEGPRTTFDSGQFYKKKDPLLPSGLLGPVNISFKQQIIVK